MKFEKNSIKLLDFWAISCVFLKTMRDMTERRVQTRRFYGRHVVHSRMQITPPFPSLTMRVTVRRILR